MERDSRHEPDVRFSLANERTFLAWGRTSVAIIATGLIIGKVLAPESDTIIWSVLAGVIVVVGALLGLLAFRGYQRADTAIRRDEPLPPSRLPLMLVVSLVGTGAIGLLLLVTT
jgi:putative membrane protein